MSEPNPPMRGVPHLEAEDGSSSHVLPHPGLSVQARACQALACRVDDEPAFEGQTRERAVGLESARKYAGPPRWVQSSLEQVRVAHTLPRRGSGVRKASPGGSSSLSIRDPGT